MTSCLFHVDDYAGFDQPHLNYKGDTVPMTEEVDLINQKEIVSDMQEGFSDMGNVLIASKMAQHNIFAESVQNGGPGDANGAILELMDYCKVGVRRLSVVTKVPRKRLLAMIHGRIDMPHDVLSKIHDVFKQVKPSMFSDEEIPRVNKTKM